MSGETEIKGRYVSIKSFFSIRYLEKVLSRHIDKLIAANDHTMARLDAIIEKLERKDYSRNGGNL